MISIVYRRGSTLICLELITGNIWESKLREGDMKTPESKAEPIKGEARFLSTETVFKSIELTAESEHSWEDAAQRCVHEAGVHCESTEIRSPRLRPR